MLEGMRAPFWLKALPTRVKNSGQGGQRTMTWEGRWESGLAGGLTACAINAVGVAEDELGERLDLGVLLVEVFEHVLAALDHGYGRAHGDVDDVCFSVGVACLVVDPVCTRWCGKDGEETEGKKGFGL